LLKTRFNFLLPKRLDRGNMAKAVKGYLAKNRLVFGQTLKHFYQFSGSDSGLHFFSLFFAKPTPHSGPGGHRQPPQYN
jgi:hypothetical protein